MAISEQDMEALLAFVRSRCGLELDALPPDTTHDRLAGLLRKHDCASVRDLLDRAGRDVGVGLRNSVLGALQVHETSWIREGEGFDRLTADILPPLLERAGARGVRLWSAAAATGEEAYSLAMAVKESVDRRPKLAQTPVRVLATDISTPALLRGSLGRYARGELESLSPERRARFLEADGKWYVVREELRRMVDFQRFDLRDDPAKLGSFDVVLVRHVAAYLKPATSARLFERLARTLGEGGVVMLGTGEGPAAAGAALQERWKEGTFVYERRVAA